MKIDGKELKHVCPYLELINRESGLLFKSRWTERRCKVANKVLPDNGEGRCYDKKDQVDCYKECGEFQKKYNPFG